MKGKLRNIKIASAYAPTEEAEGVKEMFYKDLESICSKVQNYMQIWEILMQRLGEMKGEIHTA